MNDVTVLMNAYQLAIRVIDRLASFCDLVRRGDNPLDHGYQRYVGGASDEYTHPNDDRPWVYSTVHVQPWNGTSYLAELTHTPYHFRLEKLIYRDSRRPALSLTMIPTMDDDDE